MNSTTQLRQEALAIAIGHRCNATRLLQLIHPNTRILNIGQATFGTLNSQIRVLGLLLSGDFNSQELYAYTTKSNNRLLDYLVYRLSSLEPILLSRKKKAISIFQKLERQTNNIPRIALSRLDKNLNIFVYLLLQSTIASLIHHFFRGFIAPLETGVNFQECPTLFWYQKKWFQPFPMVLLGRELLNTQEHSIEMLTTSSDHFIWAHHPELASRNISCLFFDMVRESLSSDRDLIIGSRLLYYWSRPIIYNENKLILASLKMLTCRSVWLGIEEFKRSDPSLSSKQLVIYQPVQLGSRINHENLNNSRIQSCEIASNIRINYMLYSLNEVSNSHSLSNEVPLELDFATKEGMKVGYEIVHLLCN
jgi:hypothetical protein